MIFFSKNERGEPAWELVMAGKKTVTRRLKPVAVGKILAVQPGRGKKYVCHIRVISCMSHLDWSSSLKTGNAQFTEEANKEGFYTWHGLMDWFVDRKVDPYDTFRIEFVKVEKNESNLDEYFASRQIDCAKYLSDAEFETLQGLHRKVELLKKNEGK